MLLCGLNKNILSFLLLTFLLTGCGSNSILQEVKKLPTYPSASGIEYFNNKLFVIGDDATHLLLLDSSFIAVDSIALYPGKENRISKASKPDLESILISKQKNLLLLGSGSLSPYRNIAWLIDPVTKQKDSIRLDTFYQRILLNGIKEINIEGACSLSGSVILSNRGHKAYSRNYLILTNPDFWNKQQETPLSIILLGGNIDTSVFNGVSGIAYATKSDRLIMTVSTENTSSVYEDGAIGKSYIWIIKNISSKKRWKSVTADQVIDLDAIDSRFTGHKIESVTVIKETKHFLHLVLAADNDDGSSTLFKLLVEKK